MLLYDNVDFVRNGVLEHGILRILARIPVPLPAGFADTKPRLKPAEIKPELFIFNDADRQKLSEYRVCIFNQVHNHGLISLAPVCVIF